MFKHLFICVFIAQFRRTSMICFFHFSCGKMQTLINFLLYNLFFFTADVWWEFSIEINDDYDASRESKYCESRKRTEKNGNVMNIYVPFLPRYYHMTRAWLLPFINTVVIAIVNIILAALKMSMIMMMIHAFARVVYCTVYAAETQELQAKKSLTSIRQLNSWEQGSGFHQNQRGKTNRL